MNPIPIRIAISLLESFDEPICISHTPTMGKAASQIYRSIKALLFITEDSRSRRRFQPVWSKTARRDDERVPPDQIPQETK
jgi:hypothetical protein